MATIKSNRHMTQLGVSYATFAVSLHRLLKKWLAEELEDKPLNKISKEDKTNMLSICLESISECNCNCVDENDISVATAKLLKLGVLEHFNTAVSHRIWIRRTYKLLTIYGVQVENPKMMADLVRKHDLSKFTAPEVLGYSIMFGNGLGFRTLTDPEEKKEWENSLHAHYAVNPHHPEYFKTYDVSGANMVNLPDGKTYLEESLIDMLACRGERDLKDDAEFSLSKWLTMPMFFLKRYTERDREWVLSKLQEWQVVTSLAFANGTVPDVSQMLYIDGNAPNLNFTA